MNKSIRPLVIAAFVAASTGVAHADDNSMSPWYGDSWADLQMHDPSSVPVPSLQAQADKAEAQQAWGQTRDRMRAGAHRWRERTASTFHRMTGTAATGTAATSGSMSGTAGTSTAGTSGSGTYGAGTASPGTYGSAGTASPGTYGTAGADSRGTTGSNATGMSNATGSATTGPGGAGNTYGSTGSSVDPRATGSAQGGTTTAPSTRSDDRSGPANPSAGGAFH